MDTTQLTVASDGKDSPSKPRYRHEALSAMLSYLERRIQSLVQLLESLDLRLRRDVVRAAELIVTRLSEDNKLLIAGNGGSASQAEHMAAELVGRFHGERRGLPALALTIDGSTMTAIANDYGYEQVFARQVEALGQPGDVLVVLSTSGRSPNVIRAVAAARQRGLGTIAILGDPESPLLQEVDIALCLPGADTATTQEGHLVLIHIICGLVESALLEPLQEHPLQGVGEQP